MNDNITQLERSISEDFETNLKTLNGKELGTFRNEKFRISIGTKMVEVTPLSSGKKRPIEKRDISKAYYYLRQGNVIEGVGSGRRSIRGLGFSVASPAYVWAILSNFDDIGTEKNKLYYNK